jgi:hypothetical protein
MTSRVIEGLARSRARRDDLPPLRRPAADDAPGLAGDAQDDERPGAGARPLPSPMSLFGSISPWPGEGPAPHSTACRAWVMRIERLLLCTDSGSRCRVRFSLGDDSLPGTDVEIGEACGEWHVGFFCRIDAVCKRLAGEAAGLARRLAHRLDRGVCVQVQAEGGRAAAAVIERAVP